MFMLCMQNIVRAKTPRNNMPTYEYTCEKCGIIEVFHGITEDPKTICPECGSKITKNITAPTAFIFAGRQVNQYSDVKAAKFWRDADGNKHRVTPADGSTNSPTVSRKRKRTDEEVAHIKKLDAKREQQKRIRQSQIRQRQQTIRAMKTRKK